MTDTTINEPSIASLEAVIKNQTSNVERIENAIMAFSNTALQILTGVPHGQTEQAPAAPAASARRRGRPPGSVNRAKAETVARVPHPTEIQIAALVDKAGCLTQSELSEALGIERALVQNHTDPLLEDGKIKCMYWKRKGEHRHLVYYRPDWVKERSRGK